MGPDASSALPAVLKVQPTMAASDQAMILKTALALGAPPAQVVQLALPNLKDTADLLIQMGPAAATATPQLLKLLDSKNADTALQAAEVLLAVDPTMAKNPRVFEVVSQSVPSATVADDYFHTGAMEALFHLGESARPLLPRFEALLASSRRNPAMDAALLTLHLDPTNGKARQVLSATWPIQRIFLSSTVYGFRSNDGSSDGAACLLAVLPSLGADTPGVLDILQRTAQFNTNPKVRAAAAEALAKLKK